MKKFLFIFALCLFSLCCIPQFTAAADSAPVITDNEGAQEPYYYFAKPVTSYFFDNGSGFTRVEYTSTKADTDSGSGIVIEKFDRSYNFLSRQTLEMELPIWGGFFSGTDYNFIIVGQENHEENDSKEVIRVIRYTKNWNRVDSVGLYGANTVIPFDAGSLRAVQYGDMLYIRTAHEMYTSSDGLNHQANLTFSVKIGSSLSITDSFYGVLNSNYGYCSHSFNQFIDTNGSTLVAVDHGDAYPRSIVIFEYSKAAGGDKFHGYCTKVNAFNIFGNIGANYTGVSVGGFEVSDSSYLIAGRSIDQDSLGIYSNAENIFITSTPINNFTDEATTVTWLTSYAESDNADVSTPQFVKINGNQLLVMWTVNDQFYYTFLDASGKRTTDIYTGSASLSDCQPMVYGNKVRWYCTDGFKLYFYEIDLSSPSSVTTAKTYVDAGKTLSLNTPVNVSGSSTSSLYSFTAPADGTYIFTSIGDADTIGYLFNEPSANTSDAILKNDYRYDYSTGSWLENFYLEYTMKKGETVYLRVSSWMTSGKYQDYQIVVNSKSTVTTTTTTTTTKKPTTTATTTKKPTTTTTTTKKPTTTTTTTKKPTTTTTTTKKPTTTTTTTKKPTTTTTTTKKPTTTTTTTKKPTTTTTTTKKPTTTATKATTTTTTTAKPTTTTTTRPTNSAATVTRLAGGSRNETAVLISSANFDKATNVILASGDNYADALAGGSLAYALDAPILLVRGSKLDSVTLAEIQRLGATDVYILGGKLAISDDVFTSLQKSGYKVERIAGASRFDTAVAIAQKLQSISGAPSEVFFAYSHNYPDALAISGIAAIKGCPVLYISADGKLSDSTAQFVSSCGVKKATILGGTLAISPNAEANIEKVGPSTVVRIAGQSRYDTCLEINKEYASILTGNTVCIATGTNYPDALAGGVFAAVNKAPMVLVGTSLTDTQKQYLSGRDAANIYIFGGTIAVSQDVENQLKNI